MKNRSCNSRRLSGRAGAFSLITLPTILGSVALVAGCGLDGESAPETGELASQVTVSSFLTSSCTTAVVLGLSRQIADEVSCQSPSSLARFAAGSGITITGNAVLPYMAANAKTDLQAVGNVQVNSGFRTIAQQYLLVEWFDRGRCGITAAAAVGRSNHESGRAVDLANFSARVSAMAAHHWSHDVAGDPVHFDHLTSSDIRGKDTLAFQRLWNRNNPSDKIAEDGDYGPMTEARLKKSPATGFAKGASCVKAASVAGTEIVAVDGPDRVAPGATAHYAITLVNTTDADWPTTATLSVAGGAASELYDAATWTSNAEVGPIGIAIPAGGQGVVDVDIVAPIVTTKTAVSTELAVMNGAVQVATVPLALMVTPDGDENTSADSDDPTDDAADPGSPAAKPESAGCSTAGGAGWLAFAPVLLVLRRRRR